MKSPVSCLLAATAVLAVNGSSGKAALPSVGGENAPPNGWPAGTFVEVARTEVGGHFFSQVIYAPSVKALVSWGTQTHHHPVRTHETRHFLIDQNRWIDAWPPARQTTWSAKPKQWPDWNICSTAGAFYDRDGVQMPRPTSSFYQVCWDDHNRRLLFYVASMTFSYEPVRREWKLIHDKREEAQPPALLLWGSLCYEPVSKQVILFGGGGVDRPDGRPHTWTLDVTTDRWRPLELDVEPPARCNSRMVYDQQHELIVLFGGDGQDRGLADTWVFDVRQQKWQQRRPPQSPYPRHSHAMASLDESGKILLVGGRAVADYRAVAKLSNQVWVYDAGENTWTPLEAKPPEIQAHQWCCMESIPETDEVILVVSSKYDHSQVTYRFRYDPEIRSARDVEGVAPSTAAYKTQRTGAWYIDQPPADREAHARRLADLPPNRWVEVRPPKSTKGRTWGSAVFDTDRGVAMKWGGGHSGYQGTDMAFYDVAANRFTIDRTPAFTPDPFDRWARRPASRTFFNQPWARHMRHTCAYDAVRKLAVFTDAGGSEWYDRQADTVVKHTWLYDPLGRKWLEPIPQPFPGGGSVSPIAVPTPAGVVVYQHERDRTWEDSGRMYRFVGQPGNPESWGWEEIQIEGPDRPYQREQMTIVYDQRRERMIFLSQDRRTGQPLMWFFSMKDCRWVRNPRQPAGGVSTREAVYVPDQDAVLAYGPSAENDPIWTRVYLCEENRWVPLDIETPQYTVHEVALEYDPIHKLAGPPYVLNQANAVYVLTADIAADRTAFEIAADDVTLDLDGHTVVFGRTDGDNFHGVRASGRDGLKLQGGAIEEGPGRGRRRFPVFMQGCRNVEIAGISATYHGKDGQGILFNWQGAGSNVHHNVVYDRGTETTSRHQQLAAIHFSPAAGSSGARVHHNIVPRARQSGIQFGASEAAAREGKVQTEDIETANNMVYLGSCMTNSMGVSASGAIKGFVLRDNRIYGRGEMPECIFVGTGASHGEIFGNYTYSHSTGKISREYGSTSSLSSALRMCWGPHHLDIHDNTFVTGSGVTDGFRGNARCIWAACSDPRQPQWKTSGDVNVEDNEIVAMLDEPSGAYARAITVCGHHESSSHGLVFRNNRVTTNGDCVVLSESYGCGSSDVRFIGNTFVKAGHGDAFAWLRCGYWDKPTTGSSFFDSRFVGGASVEDVTFAGAARRSFGVGWTLCVKTEPGAVIVVADVDDQQVFRGTADAEGHCRAALLQYLHTPEGKTILTPHKVTVSHGGKSKQLSVTMEEPREIEIQL